MEQKPTVIYDSNKKKNPSLCIFASDHSGLYIDDFIYYYLAHLYECNFDIVFVSGSAISEFDLKKLKKLCKRIVEKENAGVGFSSYKAGLQTENFGRNYNSTLLTNSHLYGPLFPLNNMIKSMESFDFWGAAENYERIYHLQSFFLHFNSRVTQSNLWKIFWNEIGEAANTEENILHHEIALSCLLIESSQFNYSSYLKSSDILGHLRANYGHYFTLSLSDRKKNNFTLYFWDILIEKLRYPFFRKILLDRKDNWKEAGIITRHWEQVISNYSDYPVKLIHDTSND